MLRCSACIQKCMRTAFSRLCISHLSTTSFPIQSLTWKGTQHPTWFRRNYASDASTSPILRGNSPALLPQHRNHSLDQITDPLDIEPYNKSNLEREVRWLKDPVKLADHTVNLLRKNHVQKAVEIVRLASKHSECTVSWNHLIDHEMGTAKVDNAFKLFNEMKKRAQQPDAYTFTILLRGLSSYPTFSQSTSRALHIYQLMSANNSPVKPSIIHTNAVLKVCAMTHDIDNLLRIAAELPTRGNGSPNKSTYTIILNAIRSNTLWPEDQRTSRRVSREEDSARSEARALAVQQGRRLWVEIQKRWMSGDLLLDEELVCAFGRILLLGEEVQDHDDILSLFEQTMGISRQIARQANSAIRKASGNKASGPNDDLKLPPYSPESVDLENSPSSSKEDNDTPESPNSSSFAPFTKVARPSQSAVHAGQNTLSLVLHACIRLKYDRAAQNYWGLLTSPDGLYQILPDSENYHMYLRLLRLRRSSKLAAELVDEMRSGDLTGKEGAVQTKTFIIALSCCVRDTNNSNSIVYAGRLVKMMMDTLPYPDAKALRMYLQVALGQKPRDWRVIMGAIRDSELGVKNLRSLLAYDPVGPKKQNEDNILELVRGLISAFDVVLDLGNEEMASVEKRRCREQRHALAAYVTRMHNRLLAEGKIVGTRKGEDRGRVRNVTSFDKSRNGSRSDEHYQADEKGEDVDIEDDKYERVPRRPAEDDGFVLPEKGGWNKEWKERSRQRKKETEDLESVDMAMAWKRDRIMRNG